MKIYNKSIDKFDNFYTAGCTVGELNEAEDTNFVILKDLFPEASFVLSAKRDSPINAMKRVREMASIVRAAGLVEYHHIYGAKEEPVEAVGTPVWEREELEQWIKDGELLTDVQHSLIENQKLSSKLREILNP